MFDSCLGDVGRIGITSVTINSSERAFTYDLLNTIERSRTNVTESTRADIATGIIVAVTLGGLPKENLQMWLQKTSLRTEEVGAYLF